MQSVDNKSVLELSEQVQANVETWGGEKKKRGSFVPPAPPPVLFELVGSVVFINSRQH